MQAVFAKPLIGKKIALLTLQHFANAPRAQKEAGALASAGAEVTVIGSWWSREKADEDLQPAERLGVNYVPLISLFAPKSETFIPRLGSRLFCANMLQDFIYTYYPDQVDLRTSLAQLVLELCGSKLTPDETRGLYQFKRFIGWKMARRIKKW